MNKRLIVKLAISLILPLLVGYVAGMFTAEAIPGWYTTLKQPSFNPPNWVFAPVWTILYVAMGISLYWIWKIAPSKQRNNALLIFTIQLALNFLWSFFFFYFKNIGLALVDILILWIFIVITIIQFYKLKPVAAYANLPYLLWVSFATVLNMAYYLLN